MNVNRAFGPPKWVKMEMIKVPIEATMLRKYLDAKKNGEYLGPIGHLDEALRMKIIIMLIKCM